MPKSWTDFYNELTNNGALVTQNRQANITVPSLNYTSIGGFGGSGAGGSSKSKSKSKGGVLGNLEKFLKVVSPIAGIVSGDEKTVGMRAMDVLSRGNYASANVADALVDGENPLTAAWRGISGQEKNTYADVLREHGHDGRGMGTLGFVGDVLLDPTTYIGAGAVKSALKVGEKGAAKIAGGAVKAAPREATKVLTSGAEVVPAKDFESFVRNVTRNKDNPGEASIFDNIIDQSGNPVTPRGFIPAEGSRTFNVGSDGITDERFMLPGPTPEVIAGRVKMGRADELAKSVSQFKYGSWIDEAPDTGPFVETTRKVPIEQPVDELAAEGAAAKALAQETNAAKQKKALLEKYKGLSEAGDPDLKNVRPEVATIMSNVDEPVYARYTQKIIDEPTEAGRKQSIKVWVPDPTAIRDGEMMYMGEIRTRLMNPKTSLNEKKRLMGMLGQHIKAVEDYVASKPAGFTGAKGATTFYREMYGTSPKDILKPRRGAKASTDDLGLPASPFEEAAPTFKEVKEWAKMDWQHKLVFMQGHFSNLEPEHMAYLSQASNQKSFATRLKKLQTLVSDSKPNSAKELAESIRAGRIQSLEEPGIPELLAHYNVKTLKQLAAAIEKDAGSLSAAEKKMLERLRPRTEPVAATKTAVEETAAKELGPTGRTYAPYENKIVEQVKEATTKAAKAKKKSEAVVPAEKIIEQVLEGNKTAFAEPKVSFSIPSQASVFDKALKIAVNKNIITPKDTKLYAWLTARGVKRTSPVPKKGLGRVDDAWNKYSQYDFFKALFNDSKNIDAEVKTALNAAHVKGVDRLAYRADYMYNLVMEPMRAMDNLLKEGGIFPVAGTKKESTPLSFYDVFSELPDDFVKKYIFTLRTAKNKAGKATSGSLIAPTQLMDVIDVGVAGMKHAGPSDDLEGLIRAGLLEKQVTNAGNTVPNGMPLLLSKYPEAFNSVVNDIMDTLPALAQKVEKNAAQRKLWHENQVKTASQDAMDVFAARTLSDDYSATGALELASEAKAIVSKISVHHGLDADDAWAVGKAVDAALPDLSVTPRIRAEAKRADNMAAAENLKARVSVSVKEAVEAMEDTTKIMQADEALAVDLRDAPQILENAHAMQLINAFAPHWGNEHIRKVFLNKRGAVQTIARSYAGALGRISTKNASQDIRSAWKELQLGTWSTNPAIKSAQAELNKAIEVMFSGDPKMAIANRRGLTADELNAHFDHYKIPNKYRFKSDGSDLHDAWKTWDTEHPLQLLSQMHAATMAATGKKLLGTQLMEQWGSKVAGPGMVKLRGSHEILKYIDTDTYYFPREIALEMRVLNKFLEESMKPAYNSAFLRTFDTLQHAWKAGVTIYRPGHHMRNMVGDVWFSFMAGVNSPTVYRDALHVMKEMRGRYDDFDALKALSAGDDWTPANASQVKKYAVKIKGSKKQLTASELYRGLYDRGLLPDYRALEDIQMGGELNKVSKFRPAGGRIHDAAATVSESRDHWVRLAQAIDIMKKGNFKTLDEAFDHAAQTVRKWHPDGSDLTHFEQKYMRRIMPFYSWMRKAIPLVLEGMVMQPGKALIYPKAIQAMAAENGIDLESLSNPFPLDQLFPTYLTDGMEGPTWQSDNGHYWGISPGVPMMDVLGDYAGGDIVSTVGSSTTMPLKLFLEQIKASGDNSIATDIRTDQPYYDLSDYVDKQIPNSNYLIGLTGMSPSSGFTQAKGGADREPQPEVERNIANFLSGFSFTDMSKPSTIKRAKREQTMRENAR